MTRGTHIADPGLMTIREVAERWNKSVRTLQRWRAQRYGPDWIKIGLTAFYRLEDVQRFERRQRISFEDNE